MLIKVCPKCGSENKLGKASCSGCYASLEGVPETEGKERPAAAPPPPAPSPPSTPEPLGKSEPGAMPSSNFMPPPGAPSSYGPTFNERRQPVKQGPNWGAIILVILLLAGAAFGGWWFFLRTPSPESVVRKFMDANTAGDYDAFRSCLRQDEVAAMGGEQALRGMMKKAAERAAGKDTSYEVVKTTYENSDALAVVEIKPKDTSSMPPEMTTMEMLLVQEDGKWKVDLKATGMRMMKKLFPNGIPGMPRPPK